MCSSPSTSTSFSNNNNNIKKYYINNKEIRVGDTECIYRVFETEQVQQFASLTGDNNAIHLDVEYVKSKTNFKRNIVHGALVSSLISTVVGTKLPGPGSVYISQEFNYRNPTFVGDTVKAQVEITLIKGKRIYFDTKCFSICKDTLKESLVIDGPATIYHPDIKTKSDNNSNNNP
ncbi:hypothetical protein CYY_003192 [Polysphondylium violaceum]|uniref:MaoC-like domain-containing protein n=1 Tax=Polysphondylium violaceum TaxID=133409 RepID=A0A8J4PY22_9MYCE|nr:hypothetical protein CYY_003192 [Polysphondylium violaceum]